MSHTKLIVPTPLIVPALFACVLCTAVASPATAQKYAPVAQQQTLGGRPGPTGKVLVPGTDGETLAEASISEGRLHIQGTSDRDRIEVDIVGGMVEVIIYHIDDIDGSLTEILSADFAVGDVDEIRMFGLAGGDLLYNYTSIPDFIWGGLGNDVIRAGSGVSYVYGQSGVDYCFGGDGDDFVSGGPDQDYVAGEAGSDTVNGGEGIDLVTGGYWGDPAQDHDDDVDVLYGGPDPDFFVEPTAEFVADVFFDFDNGFDGIY